MSQENIEKYIQQMHARGAFDSSGAFRVNPYKAQAKMARFQTGDSAFYLLRLVQTGVCLGATSVEVRLQWDLVRVELRGNPDFDQISCDEILEGLGRPFSSDRHTPSAYLINALNLVLAETPASIELAWTAASGAGQRVRIAEEGVSRDQVSGRPGCLEFVLNRPGLQDKSRVAAETRGLYQRAGCAPIPVLLDGVLVNSVANPASTLYCGRFASSLGSYLPDDFILGERYLSERECLGLCLFAPERRRATFWRYGDKQHTGSPRLNVFIHDSPLQLRPAAGRWAAHGRSKPGSASGVCVGSGRLTICCGLDSFSTITYVQAGVVLHQQELDFRGVHAVACADGLATDISGQQLAHGDELKALEAAVVEQMQDLRSQVCSRLAYLKARFDWTPERKKNAVVAGGCVGAYAMSAAILGSTLPLWGGVAWAGSLFLFAGISIPVALRAKKNLDADLRELVREPLC